MGKLMRNPLLSSTFILRLAKKEKKGAKEEDVIWQVSGECTQWLLKLTPGAEELAPGRADMIFHRAAIVLSFLP